MSISLVAHTTILQSGFSGGTSAGINCTGASLIIVGLSFHDGFYSGFSNIQDNQGNVYTPLNKYSSGGSNDGAQLFYCQSPTVSSGQQFTSNCSGTFIGSVFIAAFSGTASFDKQDGATSFPNTGQTTVQPGTLTAATASSLFVTVFGAGNNSGGETINSSFSITDSTDSTSTYSAGALGYKVSTTENPTWTIGSTPTWLSTGMAIFAPAGNDLTVAITGVSATSAVGNVGFAADLGLSITGVQAQAFVGNVSTTGGTPVGGVGGHFLPLTEKQLKRLRKEERKRKRREDDAAEARLAEAQSIEAEIRAIAYPAPSKPAEISVETDQDDDEDDDLTTILLHS